MNRRRFLMTLTCLVPLSTAAYSQDRVVGAVWEIKNPKTGDFRRFRATPDGKIWSFVNPGDAGVPRIIGTWKGHTENTVMIVDRTPDPKYHGKVEVVLVKKDPPTWQGKFTHKSGREFPMDVKLLAD